MVQWTQNRPFNNTEMRKRTGREYSCGIHRHWSMTVRPHWKAQTLLHPGLNLFVDLRPIQIESKLLLNVPSHHSALSDHNMLSELLQVRARLRASVSIAVHIPKCVDSCGNPRFTAPFSGCGYGCDHLPRLSFPNLFSRHLRYEHPVANHKSGAKCSQTGLTEAQYLL